MILAKVIGSVTCTITVDAIKKAKLKIVKTIRPDESWAGKYSIVEDCIGSGAGDKVLIAEDEIAVGSVLNGKEDVPIKYCIVAKVEDIYIV